MISQYLPADILDKIGKLAKLIDVAAVIVIVFVGTLLLRVILYRLIDRFFDGDKGVFKSKTDDSRRKNTESDDQKSYEISALFYRFYFNTRAIHQYHFFGYDCRCRRDRNQLRLKIHDRRYRKRFFHYI